MIVLNVAVNEPIHCFKDGELILTITRVESSKMSFECDRGIRVVRDKVLARESENIAATTSVNAMEFTED